MILLREQNMNCKEQKTCSGEIFEVERFAIHDGPGIRTVVFFRGCPLHCLWCANPESQRCSPQIMYWKSRCIGCMTCVKECPKQALVPGNDGIFRNDCCVYCGHCVDNCTAEAQTWIGSNVTAESIFREVVRDKSFYANTGGGVTFSGGEALLQSELLIETARLCRNAGIHTAIETSGYAAMETIQKVIPWVDLFLFDFKCMDPQRHIALTGVDNTGILQNFQYLLQEHCQITVRYPLIGGYNDDADNVAQMIAYLREQCPGCRVDILPYHTLGVSKYKRLQMEYPAVKAYKPSEEDIRKIRQAFETAGFRVNVGG